MDVLTLPVGPLQTNCYLASCPKTKEAIIIDPGDSGDFISQKILDLKLQPKVIVATHGHVDHIVAVIELKLAFNIPFLVHKKDLFLLKRTKETIEYFLGFNPYPELFQWKNAETIVDQYIKELVSDVSDQEDQVEDKIRDISTKVEDEVDDEYDEDWD